MGKSLGEVKQTFLFCDGGSCRKAGAENVTRAARAYLRNSGNWDETHTIKTRCNGRCEDAPTCIVEDGHFWYKKLTPEKVVEVIESHLEKNQPVEDYLLYAQDWKAVKSEDERTKFKIKPFEWESHPELGNCQITKGLSSDQYVYPLFDHLHKNVPDASYETASGERFFFRELIELRYTKTVELEMIQEDKTVELVIGAVPKDDQELKKLKITNTHYFYQENSGKVGVRFANNKNELIGYLFLGKPNEKVWEYCTKIQLQNNRLESISV